jgi:hypothetical protein
MFTRWFAFSFRCTLTTSHGVESENIFKQVKISITIYHKRYSHSMRHATTGKMQCLAFTGCVDLCIEYFEHFVLALPINFLYDVKSYVSTKLCMSRAICIMLKTAYALRYSNVYHYS